MSILRFFLKNHVFIFFLLFLLAQSVQAGITQPDVAGAKRKLMQWGGDQSTLNRKTHIIELRGNAYVYRDNEEIHADEIDLNNDTQYVKARGRVRYQYGQYYVRADAVDVDLKNKTGFVINGNISNGQFSLKGARMEQVGVDHYLVKDYNYSTCFDCPNSWEMTGKDADITLEGYAYMNDFVFKALDASLFWLPYMIIPVKTKRQSGFIFPRFGTNGAYGPFFVQPYFWAVNDWSDMTLGAGYYSRRGSRFEWEGRYSLTKQSEGKFNLYWTRDQEVGSLYFRYAIKGAVTQEFPLGFEAKLRLNEVSDSGYPITYSDDVPGRLEPALTSELYFTRNDPQLSTIISLKRIRNLLRFDPNDNTKFLSGYDPNTVQEFPKLVLNSNDQFIFGKKIATGVETRFNRFRRVAGQFDVYQQGLKTIREADRFTLIPNVYTTLNPWPWLSVVPSVQYRAFLYTFNNAPGYPDLARGYLLTQAEASFQLEKTYASSTPGVSFKHTIRPTITYSRIPTIQESGSGNTVDPSKSHPFIEQIQNQARPGQYFDNSDIVPLGATQNLDTYFVPLGNSLTYGLVTQLFKREKQKNKDDEFTDEDPSVSKTFEAGLTQTLDIREVQRQLNRGERDTRIKLSPLFTHFQYQDRSFSAYTEYTYYSYLDRYLERYANSTTNFGGLLPSANPHRVSTSVAWTWANRIKDNLLRFNRSVGLNYTFSKLTSRVSSLQISSRFSINDYVMPKGSISYNLVQNKTQVLESQAGVLFQSPSRCWQLDFAYTYSVDRGSGPIVNFALNLAGDSFTTVDDGLKK